jgi:two-component sensor histidine kinase
MFFARRSLVLTQLNHNQPAINTAYRVHTAVCRLMIFLLISLLNAHLAGFAQEYGYRHYNVKDGLTGSKVYHINQDRDGFIWFATETGVSRFDGTHFKNFTINDGLPDNEIIRIYSDSQGRVWLVPFKNSISYYYRGKIYNQQNDSLLQKISLCDYILSICEGRNGDVLILDPCNLYRLQSSYALQLVRQFYKYSVMKISTDDSGRYNIIMSNARYKADAKNYIFLDSIPNHIGGADQIIADNKLMCWLKTYEKLHVRSHLYKIDFDYAIPPANTIGSINDSIICLNTTNGTIWLNILRRKIEKHFLAGKNISNSFTDREGGMWFATFNDGIYQLGAALFNTIAREGAGGQKLGVYALQKFKGKICAASDIAHLQVIQKDSVQLVSLSNIYPFARPGPVTAIKKTDNHLVMSFLTYVGFTKDFSSFHIKNLNGHVKDIEVKDKTTIIAATSNALFECSLTGLPVKTLWTGRTTCALYRNDSIYFGTLNGLYLLKPDKTVVYFGDTSVLLQNRIVDIVESANGTIWVATGSEGIIELNANHIIRHVRHSEAPGSNISRCIAIDKEYMWVGTDKGLHKINLGTFPASITKYTTSDGLPSDIINAVLIDGDTVYAGTPEGIVYLNKNTRFPSSGCDLKLLDIFVNGKKATDTGRYLLSYGNNSIRFDYVAISFKAGGDIVYSYRIGGLDTAWKTTRQTTLELISLPPGKYTFQLFGTNKFGVASAMYSAQLSVQAPFWQTAWFIIVCILASALLTWLILTRRIKSVRAKEATRQQFEQRLAELEQKALRAQMNPHFIFNCLNSIQEFIIDKDVLSANKYLSQFARLIRQTLDNSFQSQLSLEDEINYLNTYLNLEQMRFRNRFNYTIHLDKNMLPVQSMIPGMVIQPYVENAVRHGQPHKQDDRGQIDIQFSQKDEFIYCSIRDNGVGRKQTLAAKATKGTGLQSRGMALTQERIDLMNKHLAANIQISIIDHENQEGIATGTEVIITFPLIKKITV